MTQRFSQLLGGDEFTLDLSGYDPLPFPEVDRLNNETVFIKLADALTLNRRKINAIEKETGKVAFIDDWSVIKKEKIPEDHWTWLASSIRNLIGQTSDERLHVLYQKFYGKGWSKRKFPLSTRNADVEVKYAVLHAVAIETIERREGRIPSVK